MSALTHSADDFTGILIDVPAAEAPAEPSEPTVLELARETWAPIGRFASGRVEVAEELAFRALFVAAAAVTFYGLVSVF